MMPAIRRLGRKSVLLKWQSRVICSIDISIGARGRAHTHTHTEQVAKHFYKACGQPQSTRMKQINLSQSITQPLCLQHNTKPTDPGIWHNKHHSTSH